MFTRPDDLSDGDVVAAVESGWGVRLDAVEYRAVGFGSHHWLGAAATSTLFITVDDLRARRMGEHESDDDAFDRIEAALTTARALADTGCAVVVAPERSRDGGVVLRFLGGFAIAVFQHVDGIARGWGRYTSTAERMEVLAAIVEIHRAGAGAVASARHDDFRITDIDGLMAALDDASTPWTGGPFAERARAALAAPAATVRRLLGRHDVLAVRARALPERCVLTHGEPHPGNTIITSGGLRLVDWDTALVAPPERDLWTVAEDDASVLAAYTDSTGRGVDPAMIEMYRIGWDLAEIAIYVTQFRRAHTDTTDTREAWSNLRRCLAGMT